MKAWRDIAEKVAAHLVGCPMPLAETAAREAVEHFCLESHAWVESIDLEPPPEGEPLFLISPDAGSEIVAVESVTQDGRPVSGIEFSPPEELSGDFRNSDTVTVVMALKPSAQGYGIPERIWSYWGSFIRYGAIAYLFELPGRQWTSANAAQLYWRRFQRGVADARIRKAHAHAGRETHVKTRPFM